MILKTVSKNYNGDVIKMHTVVIGTFQFTEDLATVHYDQDIINNWKNSKEGQFILNNTDCVEYKVKYSYDTFCRNLSIVADLEEKKLSEYLLRFSKITY